MPKNYGKITALFFALVLLAAFCFGCSQTLGQSSYPLDYSDEVEHWSTTYGLDPYLVYAVIRTESGFDPKAQSDAGAIGLMQMTEDTFDWVKSKIAPSEELSYDALFEPGTSIRFGCYFLSYCMEKYGGDVSTAAAAYHSGMGTVDRLLEEGEHTDDGLTLDSFPYDQMSNYVRKVNKSYEQYKKLYTQTSSSLVSSGT